MADWIDHFRTLLRKRGYDNPTISFDPAYGFTVTLEDGREYEAHAPWRIERWIVRLDAGPQGDET